MSPDEAIGASFSKRKNKSNCFQSELVGVLQPRLLLERNKRACITTFMCLRVSKPPSEFSITAL